MSTHIFNKPASGLCVDSGLMLVLIGIGDIRLADTPEGAIAVHLGQHADLQPPVAGNTVDPGQIPYHREFTGQRVPKTIQKREEGMRPDQQLQAADQRSDEETRHPSMHTVRHAAVIPLAKFVGEVRIGDGITEASEVLTVVTDDVAVMKGDDLALASGQHVAVGRPTPASLALKSDVDLMRDQGVQQRLDTGPVVPDDADSLGELRKELLGQPEFQRRGLIQGNDDFVDIANLAQDLDDSLEGGTLQFRIERGEDQERSESFRAYRSSSCSSCSVLG